MGEPMKREKHLGRLIPVCLAMAAGLAGVPASAQMGRMGPPSFHGVWAPVVGKGAVYEVKSQDGGTKSMEIAIVGKETVQGKDGYWMQMAMDSDKGGQMVMKFLTVVTADDVVQERMIMQMPGRPPMEMTQMMQRMKSNSHADVRKDGQDLGSETVTVPAGTFTCEHYRSNDGGDVWVGKDVPPWGLVKYQGKDSSMVLTKVLNDAKDKIVGTPQAFNPMMMQQPSQ
jgi:hypothetical protein